MLRHDYEAIWAERGIPLLRTLKMALKEFKNKASNWLKTHKLSMEQQPDIDNEGLLNQASESSEGAQQQTAQNNEVVVKPVHPKSKSESLEKLQDGFNRLVEQLQGINAHLDHQVAQHEDLMSRLDKMPQLLESFPAVVENQKQLTEQLIEQLQANATKDQQFIETVEKIPTETAKQTDALVEINHQLAAAADTDVQMAESFNKFNDSLNKLDQSSVSQTDSIMQMSKTFATSDRYLKYIISKQNKRFMWVFVIAMGVCVGAILILAGMIAYLLH